MRARVSERAVLLAFRAFIDGSPGTGMKTASVWHRDCVHGSDDTTRRAQKLHHERTLQGYVTYYV